MANEQHYAFMQQAHYFRASVAFPPQSDVVVRTMDLTKPGGYYDRRGCVQFVRNDNFEQMHSWPRGIMRYSIFFPAATDDDHGTVEPWVDSRYMRSLKKEQCMQQDSNLRKC